MNATENIPADVMEKARILRDGAIARGASEWAAERIAQALLEALLAAQIQGLRMAAEIADPEGKSLVSNCRSCAMKIRDSITAKADELNETHTS